MSPLVWLLVPLFGATERPIVAVFDIEGRDRTVPAETLDDLTSYLTARLTEFGFQAVPRAEIKARLADAQSQSYAKCYDQACQIELGKELAAQKTLATQILRIGSDCQVTAVLYDLRTAATDRAATEEAACEAGALLGAIRRVAEKLTGNEPAMVAAQTIGAAVDAVVGGIAGAANRRSERAFTVRTMAPELHFTVEVTDAAGHPHRCPKPVSRGAVCQLDGLTAGEAQLDVLSDELGDYSETVDVSASRGVTMLTISEVPSEGAVVAWTFGGISLLPAAILLPVGLANKDGGVTGTGVAALGIGTGLLMLGFLLADTVDVYEHSIN